ncbi:hypothetical protein I3F59_005975 [Streptomyces sp. MUM 178J]|nr:hypothetical protein [Streptomyces sp. MUM 178J]WRQ78964.1 hypothetical protein I3F59_005975 [Streptomyces sp. MUM 178J]
MTAPLTPPHRPTPDDADPRRSPPEPSTALIMADMDKDTDVRADLRDAGIVLAAVTLAGVGLGLLWLWLAPRVPLVARDGSVFLVDTEGEAAVGADATFALLALGFGAASAAGVFFFRRRGGVLLVAALALGGVFASLLAWGVGTWLGPSRDVAERAREVGDGVQFDAYLELHAWGALLAWPVAAMVVHLALTALFGPRDPEPEWPPYPPESQDGDGSERA